MPPARGSKRSSSSGGPWTSTRVLNSSSPIVGADIHAFLIAAVSRWNVASDSYTEAEKRLLIDSLPLAYRKYELDHEGRLKCPLPTEFVLDDPYLKAATQRFKNDIAEGYYEKTWQNQARRAMHDRRDGKFDAFLQEQAEETFGEPRLDGDNVADGSGDADLESSDGEWRANPAKAKHIGHGEHAIEQPQVLRQKRKI
ncbi:hypothetical protein G647_03449 [Cladophialophora carrionii CBS 160.54]|uniref:ASX DEUBAD domain-containing protein n=1 Tax=Cladophialophora carrionii CBS 160.54 TaxID=1279043 RepID=V9DB58_9EURO|nr:uncharacterized protein G647_03449 [Cladophialophora carrionii CBS 160.54]ETI24080.1 hypothetical protein G647_03449 [Cladophialophora carrionii CBS 160.54]